MTDDFVTKRLYGSGSFDISFFDSAVDRYVKNQSLIATLSGNGNIRNRLLGGAASSGKDASHVREPPLLQSARVKRKLKTIVPPEPCGTDLPDTSENAQIVAAKNSEIDGDDSSYNDADSYRSSGGSMPHILTATSDSASITSAGTSTNTLSTFKEPVYYTYSTFPEHLDPALFGKPRPMSSAVMVEYDRQREQAGKFRRASSHMSETDNTTPQNVRRSSAITGQLAPVVRMTSYLNLWDIFAFCIANHRNWFET